MTTRDPLYVDVVPFGVAVGLGAQVVLLASLSSGVGLGATGWWAGVSYAVISSVLLGAALYRSGARTL